MKKLLFCISTLIFSLSFTAHAQSDTAIKKVTTNLDLGKSIIQTKDGGYALTGEAYSYGAGGEDVYVVKLDSKGNLKWNKTIPGANDESGYAIIQTHDGGYAITGETYSHTGTNGEDVYVVKLDPAGNVQWTKTIGGTGNEFGYSIVQNKDGSYTITGATYSKIGSNENVYIVKLSETGAIEWNKTISGPTYENGSSVIQTKDGGYTIGGYRVSGPNHYDFYLIKIDSTGKLQWNKTIGGAGSKSAYSVVQTKDGGFAITGATNSPGADNADVYAVKIDAKGNLQWTKKIGGSQKDIGASIIQTTDGGYAITGATKSTGAGSFDVYVVKLDPTGNIKWTKTIGGTGDDEGECIVQTTDGGYAIGGFTNISHTSDYKFYAIKLDELGKVQWTKTIGDSKH